MDFIIQVINGMITKNLTHGDLLIVVLIAYLIFKLYHFNKLINGLTIVITQLLEKIVIINNNFDELIKTFNHSIVTILKKHDEVDVILQKQTRYIDRQVDEDRSWRTLVSERLDNMDDDMKEIKKMLMV